MNAATQDRPTAAFDLNFDDDFLELDDDTQFANFRDWLTSLRQVEPVSSQTVTALLESMDRPFAVHDPTPDHDSYGITFATANEDITRCANMAMNHLLRNWGSLPCSVRDTHPNFKGWFHQGGSFDSSGWQFWEWLGHNKELAYFVCELLVQWLPDKTAEFLARGY